MALALLLCLQEGTFTTVTAESGVEKVVSDAYAAEPERHYGLGDRKEADVSVEFYPSGKIVRKDKVPAGSVVRVLED